MNETNKHNELVNEYVQNNKRPFSINNIDVIRDGGTIVLESYLYQRDKFYVDKNDFTIHTDYPTSKDNLLLDKSTAAWIRECISKYILNKMQEINRIVTIAGKIKLDD